MNNNNVVNYGLCLEKDTVTLSLCHPRREEIRHMEKWKNNLTQKPPLLQNLCMLS